MSSALLKSALSKLVEETPDIAGGKEVKLLASSLLDEAKGEPFDSLSSELVTVMRDMISDIGQSTICICELRHRLWTEFHQLRQVSLPKVWINVEQFQVGRNKLFEQSVNQHLFEMLLSEYLDTVKKSRISVSSHAKQSLSGDEMNIIRYACGYVAVRLLKKHKGKGDHGGQFVECLEQFAVEGNASDLMAYTRDWYDRVNRGGLFPLNDLAFAFFVEVEKSVQAVLPKYMATTASKDKKQFQEEVILKVIEDEDVQFQWHLISQSISTYEAQQVLLKDIVQLWVTVRGFSTVAGWMECYKQVSKKTTEKATGLRKSLSGSTS